MCPCCGPLQGCSRRASLHHGALWSTLGTKRGHHPGIHWTGLTMGWLEENKGGKGKYQGGVGELNMGKLRGKRMKWPSVCKQSLSVLLSGSIICVCVCVRVFVWWCVHGFCTSAPPPEWGFCLRTSYVQLPATWERLGSTGSYRADWFSENSYWGIHMLYISVYFALTDLCPSQPEGGTMRLLVLIMFVQVLCESVCDLCRSEYIYI